MDKSQNAILQWIYNIGHMYSQAITDPSTNPISQGSTSVMMEPSLSITPRMQRIQFPLT